MDTLCLVAGIILGYWLHEKASKFKTEKELSDAMKDFYESQE